MSISIQKQILGLHVSRSNWNHSLEPVDNVLTVEVSYAKNHLSNIEPSPILREMSTLKLTKDRKEYLLEMVEERTTSHEMHSQIQLILSLKSELQST